ncbi:MAG: hypothetical protein IPK82_11400 [Polyangiaceae bacterium]|nr:hypothetical protein [Polyangiaceae bacterium]
MDVVNDAAGRAVLPWAAGTQGSQKAAPQTKKSGSAGVVVLVVGVVLVAAVAVGLQVAGVW